MNAILTPTNHSPLTEGQALEEAVHREAKLHAGKTLALVLVEWDIFRRHRPALEKFIAFLSSDVRKSLKSEIAANKECPLNSESCHDLQKLLSVETPLRE